MKFNIGVQDQLPMRLLRYGLAILMLIHGIARLYYGTVSDFGSFLEQQGFPIGNVIAWGITLLELIGTVLLVLNFQVRYIAVWFIFQLIMGVVLVHFKEGWFVVGAGRNGMEYSVLLIIGFVAIAWNDMLHSGSRWKP